MYIPFNKPFISGRELEFILEAVNSGKISGDGMFTRKCHEFFQTNYGLNKCLLTTSCTDALEMAAILTKIQEGDEVIMPSYTFVSTANAFRLRGAKIIFADSRKDHPGVDEDQIESLITTRTKAIVPVHYAGVACQMDRITALAKKYSLFVVEDAAQAIDSYYTGADGKKKALGSIGDLGAFSFHETKNVIAGEGGMLAVNNKEFAERSEIIREKGTNRSAFFRGEVDKYGWVDIGSSYLPSDIIAAFLYAQLENLQLIQERRKQIWELYWKRLNPLQNAGKVKLPVIPDYATNNAHMFYLVLNSLKDRTGLIEALKKYDIHAVFHYVSLHKSSYYVQGKEAQPLPMVELYSDRLLRLPLFFDLTDEQVNMISDMIINYFGLPA
ncbi:MAG: dTDP-4-amino-4,6-dideoxygalactose transaminase [Chitinophagales bacterium]